MIADDATTRFSTSLAEELGRPADGEGVAVEFDWLLRGMAIFIRNPALSELITLNCCCCCCCCWSFLSEPCLLLVLLVDATEDESESEEESDPSSESEDEDEDDEDDSGDLPGGFDSTGGVLFTVVIFSQVLWPETVWAS